MVRVATDRENLDPLVSGETRHLEIRKEPPAWDLDTLASGETRPLRLLLSQFPD